MAIMNKDTKNPNKNTNDYRLKSSIFVDMKIDPMQEPGNYLFLGNEWGFFGAVEDGKYYAEKNEKDGEKLYSVNLLNLSIQVNKGSVVYVVGKKNELEDYWSVILNKVATIIGKKFSYHFYYIEDFEKKLNISEKNEAYLKAISYLKDVKKLKFRYINMNPPYDIGNKVTSATINTLSDGKCVCLMPLGQYKSKELYRHVDKMELADPEIFEDTSITNNLCICTLQNHMVDKFRSYDEMSMESYDLKFRTFYKYNNAHKVLTMKFHPTKGYLEYLNKNHNRIFINSVRIATGGYAKVGLSKDWYDGKTELPIDNEGSIQIFAVEHKNKEANDNYATFVFNSGFLNDAIKGLNKTNGTVSIAIPQIDWETISDTPLWKEGKYDEAVLDAMGLKWDGDVIVEK